MSNKNASAVFSGAKSSFNLIKEWRDSKAARDNYFHQADSLLKDSEDEILRMKRQNEEERGKKISKAGASGINLSSFDDALLSDDLENARDVYDKRLQAQADAAALREKANGERRKKRGKSLSLSAELLPDWIGFLY